MKKDNKYEKELGDIIHDLQSLDFNSPEARNVVINIFISIAEKSYQEGREEVLDLFPKEIVEEYSLLRFYGVNDEK